MKAIYDLAYNPPTFDFVTALLTFECERLRRKEDTIDLEIWPGPAEGFRRDRLWPRSVAIRRKLLAQIVSPMASMLPSIRQVTFTDERTAGFGAGRALVKRRLLLDALAQGCRPLRQERGAPDAMLITMTLRECEHWPERNSNIAEWLSAGGYLSGLGYNVVVVRDDRISPISLIDRAGLYRRAALNLFVNNGPAWFALALDASVVILRPATERIGYLYSRQSWRADGVVDQIPGSPEYQRLIWRDDTRENIISAVAQSSLAIDLAERMTGFGIGQQMIDYAAILYDPIYAELGVSATLGTTSTAGTIQITVIDDTRPKSVIAGSLETKSVDPGAFVRIYELTEKGINRAELPGCFLTFNDRSWIIRYSELRGSPNGEDKGEARLLLRKPEPVEVTA